WFDDALRARNERATATWRQFEPAARARDIAQNGARVFVIYDAQDRWVTPEQQWRFVGAVRKASGRAMAIQVDAHDQDHHDVQPQMRQVARSCIADLPDDVIMRDSAP
ncbi:MAG TPA: hypothetical protein VHN20_18735, partial [Beijerinckiaceae bacterium]|nr:hypothetical protein [Beijerinckiaceae bacterium]